MAKLFRTSGIRGIVNKEHYPDFYLHMGLCFGTVLKNKRIAVAADGRVTMPMVKSALLSGLTATGHDVVDIGVLPTPALQYYCKSKRIPGIMVTSSHNPAEYNGFKLIMDDGLDIYRAEHKRIEKLYFAHNFAEDSESRPTGIRYSKWNGTGRIDYDASGREMYINGIARLVDLKKIKAAKLKVLFDCVNGSTTQTTPLLFKRLGIKPVPLNETLDGTFPAHQPEPTEANLKGTMKVVRESDVDFGIVFDSDGDRSIFISPEGEYIDGNYSVPIVARSKLRKGDSVVTPIDSSDVLQIVADEIGIEVYYTKVGRANVAKEMLKRKSKLGGEENGGLIFAPHQYCGDGGMALGLMAEATAQHGFGNLLEGMPKLYYSRDKVRSTTEYSVIRRKMLGMKHTESDETDGIKIRFDKDRWLMVRRSGTEPVYRIYAQAGSKKEVYSMISSCKRELFGKEG